VLWEVATGDCQIASGLTVQSGKLIQLVN
ncbi:MAG: hypothetical protein HW416_3330, partial [Chloroflexi bacterium]|nr:hypothetical protein [Chloroflexota bacterium]